MLYSELVELLKDVSQTVNAKGTFIHGKRVDGSIRDSDPFPQIHLYPVTTTKDIPAGTDNHNILMGFWNLDSADSTPEQRQELITQAEILTNAFIVELVERGQMLTVVRTEPQYQTLAAIASGYALSFTLTAKSDLCV